jgi:hypothetical protein
LGQTTRTFLTFCLLFPPFIPPRSPLLLTMPDTPINRYMQDRFSSHPGIKQLLQRVRDDKAAAAERLAFYHEGGIAGPPLPAA